MLPDSRWLNLDFNRISRVGVDTLCASRLLPNLSYVSLISKIVTILPYQVSSSTIPRKYLCRGSCMRSIARCDGAISKSSLTGRLNETRCRDPARDGTQIPMPPGAFASTTRVHRANRFGANNNYVVL
jgi:hypothetical protein